MGAPEPPYLYDAPAQRPISYPYSNHLGDRKSQITLASQTSRPYSTHNGPLVDFNRHPDSYLVVTGTDLKHKTMPTNTKRWVAATRWIQFSLRILQLLAAGGALFCVICLQSTDVVQAWIMRITPGYDMLITLYAVYHLARSSTARAPGSSASYHFFAFIMDTGLIPFYAFISVFTYNQLAGIMYSASDPVRWGSFFTDTQTIEKIVMALFYVACALAGLHLVSLGLDLYLAIIYKKISDLPPDMNPLEDNLTSRKASKHRYKNSELSLASTSDEQKVVVASTFDEKEPEVRQIAFGHSRAGSDMSFSPHNPNSARFAKVQHDIYQQSARGSAISMDRPQSFMTANSRMGAASPTKDNSKKDLISDNWYVLDEEDTKRDTSPIRKTPKREPRLPQISVCEDVGFVHQPLAMNPPTPTIEVQNQRQRDALGEVSINRSGTVISNATNASSVYSESAPSLKSNKVRTPKSKYYGDLAAATRGVRGYEQLPQSEGSPRVISRSGADIADETMTFIPEKSNRRRMVSGKAAEEGRAGAYW